MSNSYDKDARLLYFMQEAVKLIDTQINKRHSPLMRQMIEVTIFRVAQSSNFDDFAMGEVVAELEVYGMDMSHIGKMLKAAIKADPALASQWKAEATSARQRLWWSVE
jgi:hypothetical protein